MSLELQPLTLKEAQTFVRRFHSHHDPPIGHRFSIGVNDGENVVGVVMIGRPVARHLDNGYIAEVTRCCTNGTKNAASKLYAAAWRACRAMGYKALITYTLKKESGTSLKAAGWRTLYKTDGGSWDCPSRPRVDTHPTTQKRLWTPTPDTFEHAKSLTTTP